MTAPTRTLTPCGNETSYARHVRLRQPIDEACRKASRDASARRRVEASLRRLRMAARARGHVFQIPRCEQCRAPLADAKGEPRWDLLEGRFVCLGRCVGGEEARRG